MKHKTFSTIAFLALVIFVGALFWQCAEVKNPLPSKSHTEEWSDAQSEDFHGAKVAAIGTSTCKSCHGNDFAGGESGVSCYTCHDNFPHPPEWMVIGDEMSHGAYIEQTGSVQACFSCHGSSGSSGISCSDCHSLSHSGRL